METYEAISKRVSVRKFSSEAPCARELEKIVDAGRRAATASNIQPVEFIVVTSAEKRKELARIAPDNGPYMEFSPAVIAVVSRPEKYYLEDGSAATQNMLVMARDLGLGTVWVAGDKKDYCAGVLNALGVPGDYKLVSLVCAGYPEGDFPKTPKKNLSEVMHWERFGTAGEYGARKNELEGTLGELKKELRRIEEKDPESSEKLKELVRKLEDTVAGSPESHHEPTRKHIEEAVYSFEASHPVISNLLGRIVTQLSNMGI